MKFVKETTLDWKRSHHNQNCQNLWFTDVDGDKIFGWVMRVGGVWIYDSESEQIDSDDTFPTESAAVAWVESKLPEVFGRRVE